MPNRAWFYAERGQQNGPFAEAQFRDFIATGIVRADTLVWTEGMASWQKAGDIPGLLSASARSPVMRGLGPSPAGSSGGSLSIDLPLWAFFGRCLLLALGNLLVVPSPWTATSYYRWIIPRFHVPGRADLGFEGKPGDIWYVIVGSALLGYAGEISHYLQLVAVVGEALLSWMLLRWVVSQISSGGRLIGLEFKGSIWGFVGWQLLAILAMVTVIGWAWVVTAWLRWICRNIDYSRRQLIFNGSGLDVLWRTFVAAIGCVLLIPIPWVIRWYTQWYVSQLALVDRGSYAAA
jgi:GYF domain 2